MSDDSREQQRQRQLESWWSISLHSNPDSEGRTPCKSLSHYADDRLGTPGADPREPESFPGQALQAIFARLHTCRAKSPAQLRQWAYGQIDRLAGKLASVEKRERSNAKAFTYEQYGDRCFISLESKSGQRHTWTIPADWLEMARRLWPLHIRRFKGGAPFVAKKKSIIHPDGRRQQEVLPLHRLFLNCDRRETVEARDGDYLNWTNGNLRLGTSRDLMDAGIRVSTIYSRD